MKIHQQNALLILLLLLHVHYGNKRKRKDIPTVEERKKYPRRSLKRDPSVQEPCCSKNILNLEEFDIIVDGGAIGSEAVDDETEEIEADRHNLPVNIPLTDDDDLDYVLSEDKSSNTDDQSDSDNSNPDTRGRKLTRLAKHIRQRGIKSIASDANHRESGKIRAIGAIVAVLVCLFECFEAYHTKKDYCLK